MNVIKSPVIPDIEGLAREMTGKTQIQIVVDKFLRLKFINKVIFVNNNLRFLPGLLKKEFAVGIKVLCELEILTTRKKSYILHQQIVDMAIALGNKKIIDNYIFLAKIYNFTPFLFTNNLNSLINLLSKYKNLNKNLSVFFPKDQLLNKGVLSFIRVTQIKFIPTEYDK